MAITKEAVDSIAARAGRDSSPACIFHKEEPDPQRHIEARLGAIISLFKAGAPYTVDSSLGVPLALDEAS